MEQIGAKELRDALKENFHKRGVLNKLEAQIRAQVLEAFNGTPLSNTPVSRETQLLNSLILDYLQWHNYTFSSNVFGSECGIEPQEYKLERSEIVKALNIQENTQSQQLPLLYGLAFQHLNDQERNKVLKQENTVKTKTTKKDVPAKKAPPQQDISNDDFDSVYYEKQHLQIDT